MAPDGRRPGWTLKAQTKANRIAANGFLPTTLPEPIKRARVLGYCGFAGEGNVVERSERYASVAKPDEPRSLSRIKPVQTRSVGRLLGAFAGC